LNENQLSVVLKYPLVKNMDLWQKTAIAILRWFMALMLVLNLTSCGGEEKAVSQEPSAGVFQEKVPLSRQISEVSPPATIQTLRQSLEVYEPQVSVLTPKPDEILQDNTVKVRFQVKDLPIFKDKEWELGPHLHVILDNEPYIAVYDLDQPLVLPNLPPGTHTLRVFASRPWHESFKNNGAYAQLRFHIFTKTDDNNPDPALPLLTYSRPKGSYGAEPILLDFYLTNAPLHLVAQENPNDEVADWRIRCTINGESFVLDRWQAVYLKGFKAGKNWVKLEFLDEQGNPVKNAFNSTVRLIDYEPKGQDTLSKIVRGELSVDQVRSIVDPNYTAKIPVTETTPAPTIEETPEKLPKAEKPPVPKTEPIPTPALTPGADEKAAESLPVLEPESKQVPQAQPEQEKPSGFFNRFQRKTDTTPIPEATTEPTPSVTPALPEMIESPQPESTLEPQLKENPAVESIPVPEQVTPQPKETPTPESIPIPKQMPLQSEKKQELGRYFQRGVDKTPSSEVTPVPTSDEPATLPEIVIESPASEPTESQLEAMPKAETETLPKKLAPQLDKPNLTRYFSPNQYPTSTAPSPTLPETPPDVIEPPSVLKTLEDATTSNDQPIEKAKD
jgi:hypothetical protein